MTDYRDKTISRRRKQGGVGIIEVLIAMVVVSFGVLGMAGLQLTGMKHSSSGYNRSKAILYAENLSARMRANQGGVETFSYSGSSATATGYDSSGADCSVKPDPYCQAYAGTAAEYCDAQEMAAFDLFSIACGNWSSAGKAEDGVNSSLYAGRVRVNCDDSPCTTNSNYTVLITWDESQDQSGVEGTMSGRRVQVRFNP